MAKFRTIAIVPFPHHQAIYPMLFKDIPGLEDTKQTLMQSARRGQVHHAQLFFGGEGSANLAMAWAYATYVNCENRQPDDACGVCASCSKMGRLVHPDLHQIFPVAATKKVTKNVSSDAFLPDWRGFLSRNPYATLADWADCIGTENRQPQISAEESRSIIQRLSMKSFEAEYKVLLLWLPETLNTTSANALLKILEEPPARTLFLLVSQAPDKVLATIRSRTQMVRIRSFTDREIAGELTARHHAAPPRAAQIAYMADGNLNAALHHLHAETKNDQHENFANWMRLCHQMEKKLPELVRTTDKMATLPRESQRSLLQYGISIVRESLLCTLQEPSLVRLEGEEMTFVQNFSKIVTEQKAERLFTYFSEAMFHLERNASPRIVFLDTSLQIAAAIKAA